MVFHAVGSGGRAMEQMMEEGLIDGVLDYATIEISNYMFKALLDGGPTRLSTAGRLGIPQVICPGAIEVLVFNEPETVPAPFNTRKLVRHSPQITDVRLNEQEMLQVADEVSARLKSTTANAVFLAPTEGFDCYAVAGEPFHDPQADKSFLRRLKSQLPSTVEYCECSQHINEEMFARQAAETLVGLMQSSLLVGAN